MYIYFFKNKYRYILYNAKINKYDYINKNN